MLKEVFELNVLGNDVQQYFIALCIFIISYSLLHIFKHAVINKAKILVKKTKSQLDDAVVSVLDVHSSLFVFLSLYISLKFIFISQTITKFFTYAMLLVVTYFIVRGINRLIDYISKSAAKHDPEARAFGVTAMFGKVVVWILAFVFILSNFGYNITTLLAGLGIGGIAIAFALQNVLSDIFASISIYIDKPFKIGDFIIVGKDMGTVQKIGIKSTRILTLHGQQLVVSNRELTDTRVNNYEKMKRRRIVFPLSIIYSTPHKKLKKIPSIIKDIVDKTDQATFERTHWKEYGDSALIFEIVYYVESSDFTLYRDINEKINLAIKEKFEKEKIKFAYPTQTIYTGKK